MKHRIVHLLQKYFLNPPIKILFAIGIVPPGYALLETAGRKTGMTSPCICGTMIAVRISLNMR